MYTVDTGRLNGVSHEDKAQGADPPPPTVSAAKACRNQLNEKNTPLLHNGTGQASDIAKPYQIYVKQRSYTDEISPQQGTVIFTT